MALQTEYSRGTSFTDAQTAAPSAPTSGPALDGEFDRMKVALDSTQQSLALLQRDDGALANQSVGYDQINPEIYTGMQPATKWASGVNYAANNAVFYETGGHVFLLRCLEGHLSTIFDNDNAAGRWIELFDYTPPAVSGVISLANGGTGATDAPAARANLGLGPLATAASVPVDLGGTGASNPATARANLGLTIGTEILAFDAKLAAEAALSPIADRLTFYTGPTTKNTTPFGSAARSLLSLAPVADRMPYYIGSNTAALATLTAFGRSLLDDPDAAGGRTTLEAAPVAKTGAGTGQFQALSAGFGAALVLPAGGTWAWFSVVYTNTGNIQGSGAGVSAGGTVLNAGAAGTAFIGFCWRQT